MPRKITVGIIEVNYLLREHLGKVIRAQSDMLLTFSVSALNDDQLAGPDVILAQWDESTYTRVRRIRETFPGGKIVAINADPRELNLVDCVRSGVVGFVLRDSSLDDLIATIRSVADDNHVVPPAVVANLCRQLAANRGSTAIFVADARVTNRERQIVRLITEGLTNKEIGVRLNIATHTVKSHIHHVCLAILSAFAVFRVWVFGIFSRFFSNPGMASQLDGIPGSQQLVRIATDYNFYIDTQWFGGPAAQVVPVMVILLTVGGIVSERRSGSILFSLSLPGRRSSWLISRLVVVFLRKGCRGVH